MTTYEPQDNSIFFSEEACEENEGKLHLATERALKAVRVIREICNYGDCDNCPFVDSDYTCKLKENFPYQWDF